MFAIQYFQISFVIPSSKLIIILFHHLHFSCCKPIFHPSFEYTNKHYQRLKICYAITKSSHSRPHLKPITLITFIPSNYIFFVHSSFFFTSTSRINNNREDFFPLPVSVWESGQKPWATINAILLINNLN